MATTKAPHQPLARGGNNRGCEKDVLGEDLTSAKHLILFNFRAKRGAHTVHFLAAKRRCHWLA